MEFLAAIMALVSIVFITLRFVLKKSDKKGMLRFLLASWIICLIISGVFMGISASETYVAGKSIVVGRWVSVLTKQTVGYKYDTIGGEGWHPVLAATMSIFSFGLIGVGFGYGLSILVSREKSIRSKIITLIVFVFFAIPPQVTFAYKFPVFIVIIIIVWRCIRR